jgi:hypothetical protein
MTIPERCYGPVMAAGLGLAGAMLVLAGLAHCGAAPTPAQQLDVAAWTAVDALCVQRAGTRAAADDCRDRERVMFCGADGGIMSDSGSCINVTLSNGLRP